VYTLTGGGFVLQPTLCFEGFTNHWFACTSAYSVAFDYQLVTPRINAGVNGAAAFGTAWASRLTEGFDSIPSGWQNQPTFQLGDNYVFGSDRSTYRIVRSGRLIARPGKPAVLNIKHRPKVLAYPDYSFTNALTQGAWSHRTYFLVVRAVPESQINCGLQTGSAFPVSAPGYGGYVVGQKRTYRYKWIPGNNKPTVRGDYFASSDSIGLGIGWRADALGYFHRDGVPIGATLVNNNRNKSARPVDINPEANCDGLALWTPTVIAQPPP